MRSSGLILSLLALVLASCLLTTSFDRFGTGASIQLFAVRGNVDGAGGTLTLGLNDANTISTGDGPFAFPALLVDGSGFEVKVTSSPMGRTCFVDRATGTIAGADAENVAVHCLPTDATLADLSISIAPLSPTFNPAKLDYTATARTSAVFDTTTTVTATGIDPREQITIAGKLTGSGTPSAPISLKGGPNSIDVTVTAPDGIAQTKYTVSISGSDHTSDYLKASNTNKDIDAYFGRAVALFGDTLVVGAPRESSNATGIDGDQSDTSADGAGAVYVFTRTGATWLQQAYIKASNARSATVCCEDTSFGGAVALSADTLVVGSYGESSNASGVGGNQNDASVGPAGAVYVFTRTGTTWSQQAYLKASNTPYGCANGSCGRFGMSVALSGDTIAVGATNEPSGAKGINGDQTDVSAPSSGAVYIFTRTGAAWSQQAYIKASNTRSSAFFGQSVSLSGSTLVVGSPGESSNANGVNGNQSNTSAPSSGAAYVFTRNGTAWSQQAYVKASNAIPNLNGGGFGGAVTISGDTFAAGAAAESSNATGINGNQSDASLGGAGAAYVFARNGIVWSQQAYVKASNPRYAALFGGALALSGDRLVIGARADPSGATGINGDQSDTSVQWAGAAYAFVRSGTTWSQRTYVKASNTSHDPNWGGQFFGAAIAIDGTMLAVGAFGDVSSAKGVNGNQLDTACSNGAGFCGAVHVF